jgi:hypothetical protein
LLLAYIPYGRINRFLTKGIIKFQPFLPDPRLMRRFRLLAFIVKLGKGCRALSLYRKQINQVSKAKLLLWAILS